MPLVAGAQVAAGVFPAAAAANSVVVVAVDSASAAPAAVAAVSAAAALTAAADAVAACNSAWEPVHQEEVLEVRASASATHGAVAPLA